MSIQPEPQTPGAQPGDVQLTSGLMRAWPVANETGDKNSRGRLLVVGGSASTPGAILLAGECAMRAGAGKLQMATVTEVAPHLALALPEAAVLPLASEKGDIAASAAEEILELAEDSDVILIGPGIRTPEAAEALLDAVIPQLRDVTVVIDALGMAYLTDNLGGVAHLGGRVVLSPNVGELAHTLGADEDDVAADPRTYVLRLAREAQAVVASGTETTFVATPDGRVWTDDSGGPALGSSGSGDVKSGAIAGLCARTDDLVQATAWATFAHGRAGERLAARVGSVGYLARDLVTEIPRTFAELST